MLPQTERHGRPTLLFQKTRSQKGQPPVAVICIVDAGLGGIGKCIGCFPIVYRNQFARWQEVTEFGDDFGIRVLNKNIGVGIVIAETDSVQAVSFYSMGQIRANCVVCLGFIVARPIC